MSGERFPLSQEDRAILELEAGPVVGHTCKVIVIGRGAPGADALRERVAARMSAAPELARRLGGTPKAPEWVEDREFDLDRHVVAHDPRVPVDRLSLTRGVAELFSHKLERDRPLWKLDVLSLDDGGVALVWRIHHAIADGTTTMRFARLLLWDEPEATAAAGPQAHRSAHEDDERRRSHLAAFVRREFARSREGSPFEGEIGHQRAVAFAAVPLGGLHDAAKDLTGGTVNDGVLACIAGGLRGWISEHHGPLGELRVKVPVSLHHEGEHAGNRDSFFTVGLPLGEPDPVARLQAIRAGTAVRKAEHDAEELDAVMRALGRASPRLRSLGERFEASPRSFALNVSNVPGPRDPQKVGGAPVSELHGIAEIGERHALRIAVVSYAGRLHFGLCADPALVDDLDALVAGIEAEAATLAAAR